MLNSLIVIFILCSSFTFIISPPGLGVGPVPGVWCVWSDSSCMLRFCPGTNSLTLTMRQTPDSCPQEGIMMLRDKLGDPNIVKLVRVNYIYLKILLLGTQMAEKYHNAPLLSR